MEKNQQDSNGPPWPVNVLPHPLWKQAMDYVGAVLLGSVTIPIWLLAALLTRILLGKPVLFRQLRGGYGGETFEIVKFRTMTDQRDESGALLPDAERLHWWGSFMRKTSIDELPGILNILRGEMSLVGPRPNYAVYLDRFSRRHAQRHQVKPGLTGLCQTQGRNTLDWHERFELDLEYAAHRSLLLDIRILWATVLAVATRKGADGAELTTVYAGEDGLHTVGQE